MTRNLAIDLGTANTLVYKEDEGIVINEPSVIAVNRRSGEVLATGKRSVGDDWENARKHRGGETVTWWRNH